MSRTLSLAVLLGVLATAANASAGEVLSNGIELPVLWPPKRIGELTRDPLATPPYLVHPPAVIAIDVGRQLFVDDFLVESSTLVRSHHLPEYYQGNPVIKPEKPWEMSQGRPRAGVFSDGVFYDPADHLFKCWYWAANACSQPYQGRTCYATSRDGLHWEKPSLDVVPGTNIVLVDDLGILRNSSTEWLDLDEKDPQRRFKMFRVVMQERLVDGKKSSPKWMKISFSPDGIHWKPAAESDECGDRSTVFYNGLRKVWVYSLRSSGTLVSRCRAYVETLNPLDAIRWGDSKTSKKVTWVGADSLDPAREDLVLRRIPERPWDLVPSQLYNLDCVAYESLLLGEFSIWRGHPLKERPKINEVCVGFSRDGFHWTRPDRRAFCPVSEKKETWNWGNLQSAGGCCLVVGDKLYFYVGAASGRIKPPHADPANVGLAILRRDGFSSMDAGPQAAILTTRKVEFSGKRLFVNVDAPHGELRVEILDARGAPIEPFTKEHCKPVTSDSTIQPVQWKGAEDLSAVAGKPVKFRFHMANGKLYSFWCSPDASGASHGCVAAGGPGFTSNRDTAGKAAYEAAARIK